MRIVLVVLLLIGGGVSTALILTDAGRHEARAEEPAALRSADRIDPPGVAAEEGTRGTASLTGSVALGDASATPASPGRARSERTPVGPEPSASPTIAEPAPRSSGSPSDAGPVISRRQRHELAATRATAALVEDLRDDDVRWNATAAADELGERLLDPGRAWEVESLLDAALHGDDGQQWRVAAGLLHGQWQRGVEGGNVFVPSEKLLDRTVELLGTWDCWQGGSWIPGDANDEDTAAFVLAHVDRMESRLVDRLITCDANERFIHAYVLGMGKRAHLVELVAPVLIEHLADNYQRDDALMSMEALYALGEAARPWLLAAQPGIDEQQRACLELLLLEIAAPAVTPAERAARAPLNRVTWKCDDPVQSWHYLGVR